MKPKFNPFREAQEELQKLPVSNRIGICLALFNLKKYRRGQNRIIIFKAQHFVMECLGEETFAHHWLLKNKHISKEDLFKEEIILKIREWRLAWLEDLANKYDQGKIAL